MICVLLAFWNTTMTDAGSPIVIAHRGASGYLPEHSLEAKALAYGQGANFIEQDVVLSKDGIPVVLHDIHVDTVTDVAAVFPQRKREDGRYYAIDFTLAELKQLHLNERINLKTGKRVFPDRFPAGQSSFRIPTLAEEIELIQGLNASTGGTVGIYPEIKQPAWHKQQGQDITPIVLQVLKTHGYTDANDAIYLQCFDPTETRRIREELGCQLKLVQLIGSNSWNEAGVDYDAMRTAEGIKAIAQYADAIGPWMPHIVTGRDSDGKPVITDLVKRAHDEGLVVHPYTFRKDELPKYTKSFDDAMMIFCEDAKIDGLFTDFPDLAVKFLQQN
ncbi:MAG: glycerophosphodiester phosphodiesterase [Planctomycetaceae bacterium]|nr:glycerophosphodiester phosphodiesterase [Planctomycetaceae bacterium]